MSVKASGYEPKPHDLYETEAWATLALVRALDELGLWRHQVNSIWEPAAGNMAIADVLEGMGKTVLATDLIDHNPRLHASGVDFLKRRTAPAIRGATSIITNPPYGKNNALAVQFCRHALINSHCVVAMLLTAGFDSGSTRVDLFRDNPRFMCKVPLLDRISWEGNGKTGTTDHAWYIWGPTYLHVDHPQIIYERNAEKDKT